MVEALTRFVAAAAVIIAAAALLTRFADAIAERTGLGRLLVGSLFLASATSLPEIAVDFNAIRIGEPDLALGDLLGSSLFNLLILMLASTVFSLPKDSSPTSSASVQHAVAAVLSIMLTSIVAFGLLVNLEVSILRAGLFAWFGFACYLFGLRLLLLQGRRTAPATDERAPSAEGQSSLGKAITGYVACATVILLAAPYLTEAADSLAVVTGLGHSFVGTTVVAASTSLPELVATISAFLMRRADLALGNIFGSNTFNVSIILPLDWYHPGNLLRDAADMNAISAIGVILATSITAITLLYAPVQKRFVVMANGLVSLSVIAVLWLLYVSGRTP
jgi:cation:H+ antiporter